MVRTYAVAIRSKGYPFSPSPLWKRFILPNATPPPFVRAPRGRQPLRRTPRSSSPVHTRKCASSQRESQMKCRISRPVSVSAFLPE